MQQFQKKTEHEFSGNAQNGGLNPKLYERMVRYIKGMYGTDNLRRYRHSPPPYFSVHTTCARTHVAFSPALFASGPILQCNNCI